jgi:transposase
MNCIPPNTLTQQGMLRLHRLREGFKEERTACINRIRGLLAEFGVVLPQSPEAPGGHPKCSTYGHANCSTRPGVS